MKDKIAYAFGAEFVEVRISRWTHEIRVPRLVGAFAAGHIMNPRTARSQLMGGLIWGMSSALHEATELDERHARYVNDNLADYLVPVNADVPSVEVIMLSEQDDHINPAGVKGLGELGKSEPTQPSVMRSSTLPASASENCRCGSSSSRSRTFSLSRTLPSLLL
jgi:xanthine dehydrogenase YagR molybdenum-binding subunit